MQLAISGSSTADLAIPAMAVVHSLIGLGEALITVGALAFVFATRPDLLKLGQARVAGSAAIYAGGLLVALLLAILSPIASADPDGLEKVAEENGFLTRAQDPSYNIIPDYVMPGVENEQLATVLAGIVGVMVVFGVAFAVAYARRRRGQSGDGGQVVGG